jgi:hypothetical protein
VIVSAAFAAHAQGESAPDARLLVVVRVSLGDRQPGYPLV